MYSYCPICQFPFKNSMVKPVIHVNRCEVNLEELTECPARENCSSINVLHYRDYSHKALAVLRSSKPPYPDLYPDNWRVIGISPGNEIPDAIFKPPDFLEHADDSGWYCGGSLLGAEKAQIMCQGESDMSNTRCGEFMSNIGYGEPISGAWCGESTSGMAFKESASYTAPWDGKRNETVASICTLGNFSEQASLDMPETGKGISVITKEITYAATDNKSNWDFFFNAKQEEPKQKSGSTCPMYKKIKGTSFVVDGFQYGNIEGVSAYFLSHFHSDHYGGLKKSFSNPLYCTRITAKLVATKIKVNEKYVTILDFKKKITVDGVEVLAIEANHCPGSAMFLFKLPNGENILHTGDFRATTDMETDPILKDMKLTTLYLDTTYFRSGYDFPTQLDAIKKVREIVAQKNALYPKALFVCGMYTIGKEKVLKGMLEELNCDFWVNPNKFAVLQCLEDEQLLNHLVSDVATAKIHVLPMMHLNVPKLMDYYSKLPPNTFTHIFAFKPSGWQIIHASEHSMVNYAKAENVTLYGLPYSDHSSRSELERFIRVFMPKEIVPTVNVNDSKMCSEIEKIVRSYTKTEEIHALEKGHKTGNARMNLKGLQSKVEDPKQTRIDSYFEKI